MTVFINNQLLSLGQIDWDVPNGGSLITFANTQDFTDVSIGDSVDILNPADPRWNGRVTVLGKPGDTVGVSTVPANSLAVTYIGGDQGGYPSAITGWPDTHTDIASGDLATASVLDANSSSSTSTDSTASESTTSGSTLSTSSTSVSTESSSSDFSTSSSSSSSEDNGSLSRSTQTSSTSSNTNSSSTSSSSSNTPSSLSTASTASTETTSTSSNTPTSESTNSTATTQSSNSSRSSNSSSSSPTSGSSDLTTSTTSSETSESVSESSLSSATTQTDSSTSESSDSESSESSSSDSSESEESDQTSSSSSQSDLSTQTSSSSSDSDQSDVTSSSSSRSTASTDNSSSSSVTSSSSSKSDSSTSSSSSWSTDSSQSLSSSSGTFQSSFSSSSADDWNADCEVVRHEITPDHVTSRLVDRVIEALKSPAVAHACKLPFEIWSSSTRPRVFFGEDGMDGQRNSNRMPYFVVEVMDEQFSALFVEGGDNVIRLRIRLEASSFSVNLGKLENECKNIIRIALREMRKEYQLDDPYTYNNFLYAQDGVDIINQFGPQKSGYGISAEVSYTFTYSRYGGDEDMGVVVAD